jgi:hypothetical protein
MDQPVPTSFIPKRPLGTIERAGGGVASLALLLSLLVFIPSILAAGGVFAYQQYLNSAIAQKSASLTAAEAAFDPSAIQDLERLDARINAAQTLLQAHVAPTALFDFLSAQTLQSVQFTTFSYTLNNDGSATINLNGEGSSFASVALQSDQFGASKLLKNVVFSNITVGTGGKITFSVEATVDPSLLSYEAGLTSAAAAPASAVSSTPTPATTTSTTSPPAAFQP